MQMSGTIVSVLPIVTGQRPNGDEWKKQTYVLKTDDDYPKHVCFDVWGSKIDDFQIVKNDFLVAYVNIESKEYSGKWFTNIKAWKVIKKEEKKPRPVELDDKIPF